EGDSLELRHGCNEPKLSELLRPVPQRDSVAHSVQGIGNVSTAVGGHSIHRVAAGVTWRSVGHSGVEPSWPRCAEYNFTQRFGHRVYRYADDKVHHLPGNFRAEWLCRWKPCCSRHEYAVVQRTVGGAGDRVDAARQ